MQPIKKSKKMQDTVLPTFSGIFWHLSASQEVCIRKGPFLDTHLSQSKAHFWGSDRLSLQAARLQWIYANRSWKTVDSWHKKPISDTVLFSIIVFWDERSISFPANAIVKARVCSSALCWAPFPYESWCRSAPTAGGFLVLCFALAERNFLRVSLLWFIFWN